jgi:hypothetical protein
MLPSLEDVLVALSDAEDLAVDDDAAEPDACAVSE